MNEDPLAAFRRFFTDDRHAALTGALYTWSLQHCACERGAPWHARSSFYSATFATHCAPPDATWHEVSSSGKFLAVCFSVDDGPRDELLLLTEQLLSREPVRAGELGRLYQALLADLRAAAVDTAHVERGLIALCSAAVAEGTLDVGQMTAGQFHDLRRSLIAGDGFVNLWRSLRHLPIPHDEHLVSQVAEAAYLANDLASLDKETQPGAQDVAESNYILFTAAHSGLTVEEATARAINRYNDLADALAHAEAGPFATLLRAFIDGYLHTHLILSGTRYPGAERNLRRLHTVSQLVDDPRGG
jgi:hypothetical protein